MRQLVMEKLVLCLVLLRTVSLIATTLVKSTRTCHADHFLNDNGSASCHEPVTDCVGFIMLNDNPGAFFFACGDE
jgi:hypothetical protein